MKTIACWNDLEKFGIVVLTGEACGLGYRLLFDLTQNGKKIVQKCFSLAEGFAGEAWNRGSRDDPHVGSVMLTQEMLVPIGVFALLETGCTEVWLYQNGGLLGVERDDSPELVERCRRLAPESLARKFAYRGTAGDRNVHQMSGRIA